MESKEELINNLKEREEYLEGEWYQLRDLAREMGGLDTLEESDSSDIKDLMMAINATRKALGWIRRMINRNK